MNRVLAGLVFGLVAGGPAEAWALDVASQCDSDLDCARWDGNPMCHPQEKVCYHCNTEADCFEEGEVCRDRNCVVECVDDMDCTPDEPTCDMATGQCLQCRSNDDCSESEFCGQGICAPDVCAQGETTCSYDTSSNLLVCNAVGNGWTVLEECGALECEDGQCGGAGSGSSGGETGSAETTPAMGDTDDGGADADSDADASSGCRIGGHGVATWLILLLVVPACCSAGRSVRGSRSREFGA